MPNSIRQVPNILVTGTPGVGKSTLCNTLSEMSNLNWIDVSKVAKELNCVDEFDEVYQCHVINEDKLLDNLEEVMCNGGNLVEYHSCEFFPERWFDLVIVLRADNTTLYDRLIERGYSGKKLEDNMNCEIFQTILEEAAESYSKHIVQELQNSTPAQLHQNATQICLWLQNWLKQHSS